MKGKRRKALGQHFLKSPGILKKIVHCIHPEKNDLIIEIGAGHGALTSLLAEKAGCLLAVEKDASLLPELENLKSETTVIVHQDILKLDLEQLVQQKLFPGCTVKIVGNLPYSISSPILFTLLKNKDIFSKAVFLLQQEVTNRLTAAPGSKDYAPVSIRFQNYFIVNKCFSVPPGAFSPPPKVYSSLVTLEKRTQPLFEPPNVEDYIRFLKSAFKHRRKTLKNNLRDQGLSNTLLDEALLKNGLKKNIRSEQVSPGQFKNLYRFLTRE
ncbi:MAG: ribosomal RNA small subunit methyltransferase A [Candidatus Aminicenantes bacterium]|nr:ribosomal RNA small subunit methyltransferase A [Candidatus Aminicenantes bacterium]